jgi:hypothetical protein
MMKREKIELPKLPRKHMFSSKGAKVIAERKAAIDEILLCVVENHAANEIVMKFLENGKGGPAPERMSRVVDVQAEKVEDAFAGELFEHTWEAEGPLGLSLTSHMLGNGNVIAVVHSSDEGNPPQLLNTVVETVNGEPVPTESQAEILALIRGSPRPITIAFRQQSGEEISAPISWEEQKEQGAVAGEKPEEEAPAEEAPAERRERADTGTMDPSRLSTILETMDTNEDGLIDEKEFQAKFSSEEGIKPQLLHYLKFKRWLKSAFPDKAAGCDDCLDSEMLLAYMSENELPTDDIPESCYVLQRVDAL